jgi:hypothetical protein
MDDQDQAQQALMKMFRRDQSAEVQATRKRPRRFSPVALAWIVGVAAVVLILAPVAFIVVYPRFGPVDTMTAFCRAESGGDYAVAYNLLSQRARAHTTLAEFTQESETNNLVPCSVNGGIPFIFGGARSSLDVNFVVSEPGNGIGPDHNSSSLPGTMSFVSENGQWRVDAMSPIFLDLSS